MGEKRVQVAGTASKSVHPGEQLAAMVRISNSLLQSIQLDDILAAATRELSNLVDFDRSDVALYLPDKDCLVLRYIHKGVEQSVKFGENREIPMNDTHIIGWVARTLQSSFRRDIEADDRFTEMVGEENLKSDIIVPLIARNKFLGTLNVGSYRKNAFSETDLTIIENCGKLVCAAVEHAMLLKEAQALGEKYNVLQKSADVIILFIDPNSGKLLEANMQALRVLGLRQAELNNASFFDLFAEEDRYQARRDFVNVLSRKTMSFLDRRMINNDGEVMYVDMNAAVVQLAGESAVQAIIHDVSQRKMMEEQIIRQNKNLQEVNRKLREMDEMKTEFLARISHELRTPLSIILAYTESLKQEDLDKSRQQEFLGVVFEQGQSLLGLIDNLLELSHLEISVTMLNISLSHVHDVVKAIWQEAKEAARIRSIQISFNPGYDIPVSYLDNKRIMQVLTCLVGNAIKFTDSGGAVEVRTSVHDGSIWIEVMDTGAGIPADKIPDIFDTFHQIDGSISRKWGGMGIGLAMAKHIVELHGGKIWVESEFGRGSIFTVSLPLDTAVEFFLEMSHGDTGMLRNGPAPGGVGPPLSAMAIHDAFQDDYEQD
ncbi:MAG: ATP-binding protein [Candidatus Latescibacterota bacterium]